MGMILTLLLRSLVVFLIAEFLPAVRVKSFGVAVLVAVVYSVLNFLLFWVITILLFPLQLLTLGLFSLVINAFLLWLTDALIDDFEIDGFGWTFIAAVLISIGNILIRVII